MSVTLRGTKGQELTHQELDTNFTQFFYSSSVNGHVASLYTYSTGSFAGYSHSIAINTGSTFTLYSESGSTGTVAGNLTVTGTMTAQEFNTEITSASIVYTSGSTKFGDSQDDNHAFTGSFQLSGSSRLGEDINQTHLVTGSAAVSGSLSINGNSDYTGVATFNNTGSNTVTIETGYVILTEVSQSLNFADDTAAAAGGIPLGGLYRNGNFVQIRVS